MQRVREVIVVEGRYDQNTLAQVVQADIFPTHGFSIFRDDEKKALLRRLAETRGLILLTDSDAAGFLIRSHLKGALPPGAVKHAYIPDVYGKERRKTAPGKEGKLGVEGMPPEVLLEALRRAGATFEDAPASTLAGTLTKADLYAAGLSGGPDSAQKRRALLRALNLPERLTADGMLVVLNGLGIEEL